MQTIQSGEERSEARRGVGEGVDEVKEARESWVVWRGGRGAGGGVEMSG